MRGLNNLQASGLVKNQPRLSFFDSVKSILLRCSKIFCQRFSPKAPGHQIILFILSPVRCRHDALALRQAVDSHSPFFYLFSPPCKTF